MKKLLILLAISSFTFSGAIAATISNVNETVIAEPCGDDGKCKKDKSCCKAKASADADATTTDVKIDAPAKPAEKAGCSKSAAKAFCCSKKASASTATDADQAPIETPEEKK